MDRRASIYLAICIVAIAITALFASGAARELWYLNLRAADVYKESTARVGRLRALGEACKSYHASYGVYPQSEQALIAHSPKCASLLLDPVTWGIRRTFVRDFARFGDSAFAIVIDDPGFDWPGRPAVAKQTPPEYESFRFVLGNDVQVRERADAIRRTSGPNPGNTGGGR